MVVHVKEPLLLREYQFEKRLLQIRPEQTEVLKGLNLEIRRGERVGLIGSTGSGKSTTVDLLMGLLGPRLAGCWLMEWT